MVTWMFHTMNEEKFARGGHDHKTHRSFRECRADRSLHAACRVYTKMAANSRPENCRQSQGAQPQLRPIINEGEII